MGARRVLLLEFNEINWRVADALIARGMLPNLARMRREGAWAAPEAPERPPHLDPWVTWVTVHTGVDRAVHGATVLEQDASTIKAKRTWDYVVDAGGSVGVFGSIGAYPPRPVPGFIVPGPFAPSDETYPEYLRPIQALNRRYTQVHAKLGGRPSPASMGREALELMTLGLSPRTCARIAAELALETARPELKWRRVSLQPLVNYDLFASLYRKYRPTYATWHTNHAAHYMHHYWRGWDDAGFLVPAAPEERSTYGAAVPHGYRVCDELLGKFLQLATDDTVVVLASSMGQQPYVKPSFPNGRIIVRFRDVRRLLRLVGAEGVSEIVHTMVPQVNVRVRNPAHRARLRARLEAAHREGTRDRAAIYVDETGDLLTLTPAGLPERADGVRYFFPEAPGSPADPHALDELFGLDTPTPKQGMHHPTGVLVLRGPGIRAGRELRDVSTLDIAPTILSLLDIPVPAPMPGRPLTL